jgi:DNA-binding SARP family transcriptional activator
LLLPARRLAVKARLQERRQDLPAPAATETRLTLLDGFELVCDDRAVALPHGAQRFVAFLALSRRPLLRPYVAGALWPETLDERAHANLRSTLWRLHRCTQELVEARGNQLQLGDDVSVDLQDAQLVARRLLDDTPDETRLGLALAVLGRDLLPDWYEDWVVIEREQFRQLRLHALDALCARLTEAGRTGEALEAGMAALAGEPLRESAHRALVRVHLAEGNIGEAIRQYRFCRRLLREQLGVSPSEQMKELVRGVTTQETGA